MSSQDSHSAHATDAYREGWDRIFADKKHVMCLRHRSAEPDMSARCTCEEPERASVVAAKRWTP